MHQHQNAVQPLPAMRGEGLAAVRRRLFEEQSERALENALAFDPEADRHSVRAELLALGSRR